MARPKLFKDDEKPDVKVEEVVEKDEVEAPVVEPKEEFKVDGPKEKFNTEEPLKADPVPAKATPSVPALYMCHVKCWVASKKRIVEPGEVVEFHPGEYIPDFFTPL